MIFNFAEAAFRLRFHVAKEVESRVKDHGIKMEESTPKIEGDTSNLISIFNFCWTADFHRIFKSPAIE